MERLPGLIEPIEYAVGVGGPAGEVTDEMRQIMKRNSEQMQIHLLELERGGGLPGEGFVEALLDLQHGEPFKE